MGTSDSFFGKTRSNILSLLYNQPDGSFYLREIVQLVQTGVGAVQRELQALEALGIIKKGEMGNQTHFKANSTSPIYGEIKSIIQKMDGWLSVLQKALTPLKEDIKIAFIYGSHSTHTQTTESDVDLFVMGDIDEMTLHRTITNAEKKIAKTINK